MADTRNHRVVVTRRGDPDVLQVIEEDLPEPGPGEVRVEVLAAGVSGYDIMLRSHRFPMFPRVPYTPGEDFVGIVTALGEGVSALEPGTRVAGWTFGDGGAYTEHICRPADQLVPVPEGVDSSEAVVLVVNYLAAHMALHHTAGARSGERLLVPGAAGGVGTALLHLGGLAGLEMYGTASKHNHELVSALGATPIDYHTEDVLKRIRSLTGDGVDVVVDVVGGARQLWRSYRTLRRGGRLVMHGMAATSRHGMKTILSSMLAIGLMKLIPDGRRAPMSPEMARYLKASNAWYRETLAELLDHVAGRRIRPVVADRIPLVEAARAHELLERGGTAGKVVLVAESDVPETDD